MTDLQSADVRKYLNTHGYPFQYAVLRRADALASDRQSPWVFEAAEYPVGTPQAPIHIDFILRAAQRSIYLVAECKRADPARARWCFFQVPYTRRGGHQGELVFQVARLGSNYFELEPLVKSASIDSCHLGVELRTGKLGEGLQNSSGLKDAVAQVLRGMNGLIEHIYLHGRVQPSGKAIFVPAIFTTASLFVSNGDLSDADPTSGELPTSWGSAKPVEWLWYTYNQSPSLAPRNPDSFKANTADLSETLRRDYSRTIAIVGPAGIDKFLGNNLVEWL